jgi:hypothetical protein
MDSQTFYTQWAKGMLEQVRLAFIANYLGAQHDDSSDHSILCNACGELTMYSANTPDNYGAFVCLSDQCLAQKIQAVLDQGGVFEINTY